MVPESCMLSDHSLQFVTFPGFLIVYSLYHRTCPHSPHLRTPAFRRIEQFTLSRKEWCISRQRAWGVPIPVLYDTETGEPLLTDSSVQHIIAVIERMGGTDAWWEVKDDAVFVADEYKTNGKTYRRGYDTMDVWFDSGSSWTLVKDKIAERSDDGRPAADLYLEGSDQHRGWFQSSLLTSGDCCNRQTSVLDPHYPWFRAR
ncbi:tRNA synthetases class I-domain-containing protein, partial [Jimgerdemannia flammicorona]